MPGATRRDALDATRRRRPPGRPVRSPPGSSHDIARAVVTSRGVTVAVSVPPVVGPDGVAGAPFEVGIEAIDRGLGDGTGAGGPTVAHAHGEPGEYAVTATVPVGDEPTRPERLPESPARDPDDDGRSEDVTGNGEATAAAVTPPLASQGSPPAASGEDAPDFDGNGRLGLGDVVTAFDASLASLDESP